MGGDGDGGATDGGDEYPDDPKDLDESTTADMGREEKREFWYQRAIEELGDESIQWATSGDDPERLQLWQDRWAEMYPELEGQVVPTSGVTTDFTTRHKREHEAGNVSFDLFRMGASFMLIGETLRDISHMPSRDNIPDNVPVMDFSLVLGLALWLPSAHTETVDEDDIGRPTSWDDFLDPYWNKYEFVQDWTPGSVIGLLLDQNGPMGPDWIREFKDVQEPRLITSGRQVTVDAAEGRSDISLLSHISHVLGFQEEGFPIEVLSAPELRAASSLQKVFVADKAPHPWAAELFADFIAHEGNVDIQAARQGTMGADFETVNPDWLKPYYDNAFHQDFVGVAEQYDTTFDNLQPELWDILEIPSAERPG